MPHSAELRAKIIAAYKSGKTMVEVGREHGVSRYVVKGIVSKAEALPKAMPKAPAKPEAPVQAKAKPEAKQEELDDDSASGSEDNDFFMRNTKFAEDLGLAEPSKAPFVETKGGLNPQEVDEALDGMMGKVLNATDTIPSFDFAMKPPGSPQGKLMEELMREGPPRRTRALPGAYPGTARASPADESPFYMAPHGQSQAIDREDVTQRIIFNVNHFGSSLEAVLGPRDCHKAFLISLPTKDPHELQNLLTMLERTRSVGSISAGFRQVFYGVAQGVEVASGFIGVKAQGFVGQLQQQDEEITMILKEIALQEWQRLKELDSPQARLGMLFCLTLAQTHTRNQIAGFTKAPMPPGMEEATKDL